MTLCGRNNVLRTCVTAYLHFNDSHMHGFFGGLMAMGAGDICGFGHGWLFLTLSRLTITVMCGIRTKNTTIARTGRQPLPTLRAPPTRHSGTGGDSCGGGVLTMRAGQVCFHDLFQSPATAHMPQRGICYLARLFAHVVLEFAGQNAFLLHRVTVADGHGFVFE